MKSKVTLACLLALTLAGVVAAQTTAPADELAVLLKSAADLRKRGEWKQAAAEYERVLVLCEKRFGVKDLRTANVCTILADVYYDLQAHLKAEKLYLRCLEIREKSDKRDDILVAKTLNDLGSLYRDLGILNKALTHLRRSLAIRQKNRVKDDDHSIAETLNTIGLVHLDLGQFPKAQEHFQKSLEIRRANQKKAPLGVAKALGSLAVLYGKMGQPERAEPLLEESLAICKKERGPRDPSVAKVLHNLADVHRALERRDKAIDHYRRSLAIWEGRSDKDLRTQAQSLSNLGAIYVDLRRFEEAEKAYVESLRIRETFGKNHLDVAESLSNLAGLYHIKKEYTRAEKLFDRCRGIREARLGKDHPAVADTLNQLAMLLQRRGESEQAAKLLDRARQISRRHVGHALAALPEREHGALIAVLERRDFERALALQPTGSIITPRSLDVVTRRAATWLLNGKAVGQEALARSAVLTRDERDPKLGGLAKSLREKREELARLALSPPRPGQESIHQARLDELKKEEENLARRLASAGSGAVAPADWYDLNKVQEALPTGAVFIDVARSRSFDYKGAVGHRWGEERYTVWLTFPNRKVHAVDLGPAAAIDDAVKKVREGMVKSSKLLSTKGDAVVYQNELQGPLEQLSKLVLEPLLPEIGKEKRWIISPDGDLWMIPWETLLLSDKRFAVQEHTLSYVLSGRDLVPSLKFAGKAGKPLVVADPDFDLGRKVGPKSSDPLRRAIRLQSTRAEAKAIDKPLRSYTGDVPKLLLGEEALEGQVKATKNPRVLVLATHGFFLPQQKLDLPDARPGSAKAKLPLGYENPLLRCGLLLAGSNNTAKRLGDDGILTGLEVLGLDLRGTDMVVLSACETGLGEVRHGEGVAGLRQAFRIAGAESVVSSLWPVPSESSAFLMTLFFRDLAKGKSRAAALREAQLKLIEDRLDRHEIAHPFFWAAFTITGRG